jgi:RNA polymerase sigma-70 factor (ECF subfamily)
MKVKTGDGRALCRIYEKYGESLLTVAGGIMKNSTAAEDILHDVFLSFVEKIKDFELNGSLKGYLARCVANRAKDKLRKINTRAAGKEKIEQTTSQDPEQILIDTEELKQLYYALIQLPTEQREVILLHLQGGVKFKDLAKAQEVSVSTIQGRYRYGMKKLRSILGIED